MVPWFNSRGCGNQCKLPEYKHNTDYEDLIHSAVNDTEDGVIPIILTTHRTDTAAAPPLYHGRREVRCRVMRTAPQVTGTSSNVPSLYVLNACSTTFVR